MLFKNVASQKIHIYAYDSTTGAPKTGDAGNITAYVSLDGTANAIDDTNPTEVDSTNMPGVYVFDLAQAETNCNSFALYAKSSTSNIRIEPIIGFTTGAAVMQTGDSYAKVNDATIGLANLKALIDAIQADIGDASGSTLGSLYAILGNAAATLTSRIPSGTPGANNGAVTTNGTKVNQTVDLQYLLGTAITEGAAGRLAAALTKFLDVATPALTAASVDQTGDTYSIANGDHGLVSIQNDIDSLVAAVITNAAGADVAADIIALKAVADLVEDILRNQLEVTDANGNIVLRADNSTDALYTVAAGITDNLTTTIRKRLE